MLTKAVCILLSLFGVIHGIPQGRVVNGTDSSIEKFPFVVSFRTRTTSHGCAGSIIAPKWILTAGHCVYEKDAKSMSIQYGLTKIDAKGPNVAKVKRYILHENYNATGLINDIALLELKGRLIYNGKTITQVKLPEQNFEIQQTRTGEPGILIGWGRNYTGGPTMKHLQEAELKVYSDAECAERHDEGRISKENICGGVDDGWKGQCNGDSGGPLLIQSGNLQVGIVSWSVKPCQVPPYPGVYTKVSHYINWIKKQMNS